jgi:hypothetical protein
MRNRLSQTIKFGAEIGRRQLVLEHTPFGRRLFESRSHSRFVTDAIESSRRGRRCGVNHLRLAGASSHSRRSTRLHARTAVELARLTRNNSCDAKREPDSVFCTDSSAAVHRRRSGVVRPVRRSLRSGRHLPFDNREARAARSRTAAWQSASSACSASRQSLDLPTMFVAI